MRVTIRRLLTDILNLLFSQSSSINGYESLSILSPAVILLPLLSITNTALESRGMAISSSVSLTLGVILRLLLDWVIITRLETGIAGACIATVASYTFSYILSSIMLKRSLKSRRGETASILICIAATTIIYILSYLNIYCIGLFEMGIFTLVLSVGLPTLLILPCILMKIKNLSKGLT